MVRLSAKERKLDIVKAAIELFSQKGFGRTTTKELAQKAGISEALLFRHFPDKESLYEEILREKIEERCVPIVDQLSTQGTSEEILFGVAQKICEENVQDTTFLRLLLFSALEGHALSELFFGRPHLPLVEFLKKHFSEGKKKKLYLIDDPMVVTYAFLDMIFGLLNAYLIFKIPHVVKSPLKKTLKSYVQIFLKGISV
ncbi:MAG: TetR/AcrR family transcriptional regulator [Deltaproteobacteria bacterium]|nr:MAG: TetR/AcrR family transcriptional regulator [Deltaproteobacteria bacterium]